MNTEYIIRLIHEYNPQFQDTDLVIPEFRRELYGNVEKWMKRKSAIAIVGLRRTGKTTLMQQVMTDRGEDAAYFSFDEEETQNKETLLFVIDYMLNTLKVKSIFLDEVHYVRDWEGVLKRYYDQKGIKFVVSGSESLELNRARESLAGRLVSFRLEPLNFREFLALRGENSSIKKVRNTVTMMVAKMVTGGTGRTDGTGKAGKTVKSDKTGRSPVYGTDRKSVSLFDFEKVEGLYTRLLTQREFFEHEFMEYLYRGAFPELVHEEDEEVVRKYINELVVKKIIYRDIPSIFQVRRRDLLFEILMYVCTNSGGLYNVNNLSTTFNANNETISNYLFYLRSAFLIRESTAYSGSPTKRARRNRKLYAATPSIAIALAGISRSGLIDQILGRHVETLFAGEYFYRDKQKNEVDVVYLTGSWKKGTQKKETIPVEVKYQEHLFPSDLKSVRLFMNKFGVERGVVITKNRMEIRELKEGRILLVPAWLALLVYR